MLVLLASCGGDDAARGASDGTVSDRPAPATAPAPAYPEDDAITGLLPAEPTAAKEAAVAARRRSEEMRRKAAAAAARAQEPTPDPADLPPMEVLHAALADKVVDRRPVGEATTFREGTEVTCFNRLANPGGTRRTVRHVWFHESTRKSSIKLSVKGTKWRTWSSLPVYGAGAWRVDVVDETGRVLRSMPFTVTR